MLRHVDLCSGIGGFALGFEWAGLSRPVLFCDIEPWCRDVLRKHWPSVPIKKDVKELANDATQIPDCDILTAGYPCQPFSYAGKRKGEEDDRHIWPDIRKVVALKRPTWVVLENVYGHISLGLDQVLADLEAEGYASRTFVVPAASVDASHRRDRVWIVAYALGAGSETRCTDRLGDDHRTEVGEKQPADQSSQGGSTDVGNTVSCGQYWDDRREPAQQPTDGRAELADTESHRIQGHRAAGQQEPPAQTEEVLPRRNRPGGRTSFWLPEPAVGRMANGIPGRVDRLKGLGNAIVPQVAEQIGIAIKRFDEHLRK